MIFLDNIVNAIYYLFRCYLENEIVFAGAFTKPESKILNEEISSNMEYKEMSITAY